MIIITGAREQQPREPGLAGQFLYLPEPQPDLAEGIPAQKPAQHRPKAQVPAGPEETAPESPEDRVFPTVPARKATSELSGRAA